MKIFNKQRNNTGFTTGFTLIETLVAISIFTLSVLVLLVSLSQGLSGTGYAKQKVTAEYLAQEGVEYMRNMRDTYMLYSSSTDEGWNGATDSFSKKLTDASCESADGCYFNADELFSLPSPMPMTQIDMTACTGECPLLTYDPSSGKYGYAAGGSSPFIRKINMELVSANEIKVLVTVSWSQGSGIHSVTFSENLANWIQ